MADGASSSARPSWPLPLDSRRLAEIDLAQWDLGDGWTAIQRRRYDVLVGGEPHVALQLLVRAASNRFLQRVWGKTVLSGTVDAGDGDELARLCRSVFVDTVACVGVVDSAVDEYHDDGLVYVPFPFDRRTAAECLLAYKIVPSSATESELAGRGLCEACKIFSCRVSIKKSALKPLTVPMEPLVKVETESQEGLSEDPLGELCFVEKIEPEASEDGEESKREMDCFVKGRRSKHLGSAKLHAMRLPSPNVPHIPGKPKVKKEEECQSLLPKSLQSMLTPWEETALAKHGPPLLDGDLKGIRLNSEAEKLFKCPLCDYVTHKMSLVSKHLKNRHRPGYYPCHLCPKTSVHYLENLLLHHNHQHAGAKPQCPFCAEVIFHEGMNSYSLQGYFSHFEKCPIFIEEKRLKSPKNDERKICAQCGKTFQTLARLQVHMETHGIGRKRYKCDECDYSSDIRPNLEKHKNCHLRDRGATTTATGEPIVFRCPHCQLKVATKQSLREHIQKSHLGMRKPVICDICNKSFANNSAKSRHKALDHPHTKKYTCDKCGHISGCSDTLNRHMRTHFPPTFFCGYCGKGFRTLHGLKEHEYVHTGAKPFKCSLCSYACASSSNLVKHKRSAHNFQGKKPSKVK